MFSNLFGQKIEKDLRNLAESRGTELIWHYRDGQAIQISKILQIARGTMVILGFGGKLKQREIQLTLLGNGARLNTVIQRTGQDKHGQTTFHCSLPEKILPPAAAFQRFHVYGNATVKVLLGTMRGDKSVVLPLHEVTSLGLSLVNDSDYEVKIGTKLFQAMASIGSGNQSHLVDLRVANIRGQTINGKRVPLLVCAYSSEPRNLGQILDQGKANARKPS